ncbi:hypothetical protein G6F24_015047 [Rhizopus arrhizus]|nr:hypothetical protein G6F24_015047 [Rhizopus arrhizus]
MSNTLVLRPGHVTLAQWRQVYRGSPLALDPAALPVVRASAAAVAAIVAKGAPVYGINTGFGKLASVRIEREDLATLQRNIVLSHAAGVGEPMPASVVRLMMALKLVSLAQGASGIREDTLRLLEAMLVKGVLPVVPMLGLQFGNVLAGAILVETVFNWPGLGRLAFDSVLRRDYPTLLGILLFASLLVVVMNQLTDLAYRLIDPRIKTS